MKPLDDFVKERRKAAGLTQEEFADRAGVALTVIRKIEQGKSLQLTDKQIERAFERLLKTKAMAVDLIERSFLSEEMQRAYVEVMEIRYKALD